MKIGIMTYHAPCNFGANLQAYSSMKFFQSCGYEVVVINYIIPPDKHPENADPSQAIAHWTFSQSALNVTKIVRTGKDIYDVVEKEKIDVVAIGADAVWNKRDKERLSVFFADWLWNTDLATRVKVIALSPAFMGQTYSDLPDDFKEKFKRGLLSFASINARDAWTMQRINEDIIGSDYIRILNPDPVFLLNEFVGIEWDHPSDIVSKGYILVSLGKNSSICSRKVLAKLRKRWNNKLLTLAHQNGYKVVEIPIPEGSSRFSFDYTVPYPIDPLQWFLWIKNAKGYFGLRFHAVVSAISSGTPFLSLDIYGKAPLWNKLLNLVGIHRFDSQVNISSKIRNVLQGSGFENNRINASEISFISPRFIMDKLLTFDTTKERVFKDSQVTLFKKNMNEALDTCVETNLKL